MQLHIYVRIFRLVLTSLVPRRWRLVPVSRAALLDPRAHIPSSCLPNTLSYPETGIGRRARLSIR